MLPMSVSRRLGIEVGEKNFQICTKNKEQCFRARPIAMAAKYPGLGLSSFEITSFLSETRALVSNS